MNSTTDSASNNKVAIILTEGFSDWEYALLAGTGRAFYGLDIAFFSIFASTAVFLYMARRQV